LIITLTRGTNRKAILTLIAAAPEMLEELKRVAAGLGARGSKAHAVGRPGVVPLAVETLRGGDDVTSTLPL